MRGRGGRMVHAVPVLLATTPALFHYKMKINADNHNPTEEILTALLHCHLDQSTDSETSTLRATFFLYRAPGRWREKYTGAE